MRRIAVGAALALVLAGCGGDPTSDPSPTPSSPVTSPVSTTPSAPVMPEEAKADTKAGAVAFVKYYIELVNHAQATGDTQTLAGVEDSACKSCEQGREYLSKIYGSGGHVSGGAWTVRKATAKRSGENWAVTVVGEFAPSDVYPSPGAAPNHANGGRTLTNFVVWFDNTWKVRTWFSG